MNKKIWILLWGFTTTLFLKAQNSDYKLSLITTGVSMSIFNQHKLTLYGGISMVNEQQFFRTMPTFNINPTLSLAPTYTYNSNNQSIEHYIMPTATLSIPVSKNKKWIIKDRNIYHYKIRHKKDNTSYYRNRIGITYKGKIGKQSVDFFLNEEMYVDLNNTIGFYRNQVSIGGDIRLGWINPQLMYIYQLNKGGETQHLFNASFIIPLENFGFFKKH